MADNIIFREYGGASRTIRYVDVGSGVMVPAHILFDSSGAELKGEKASNDSLPVVLPSNMPLLGRAILKVDDSFSRPADTTQYAVGDLVANSTTAGSVTAMSFVVTRYSQGAGELVGGRISKTSNVTTDAEFRVHLYVSSPTAANGDNAAWLTTGAGATPTYIGHIDSLPMKAFSDGASARLAISSTGTQIRFKLSSGSSIKELIEARGAYVPTSGETFVVTLEILTT